MHDRVRRIGDRLCTDLKRAESSTGGFDQLKTRVALVMQSCLDELAATGCEGQTNQVPSNELWRVAQAELCQGSLQLHARMKPLGYPGDHRLLDRICRKDVGGTALGLAMDHFFQDQAAPQAVRNRCRSIARTIHSLTLSASKQTKIVSVGSGPAWDIRWGLEGLSENDRNQVNVTLVDLDPKALAFCEKQIGPLLPNGQLHLERANLKRLPGLRAVLEQLANADLIFCSGYFDYLSDVDATEMLRALWPCVGEDGQLLVFNFSEHNPSRPYMEWIGNWYLNHRSAESMLRIVDGAEFADAEVHVGVEPVGVNLYVRICREGWH